MLVSAQKARPLSLPCLTAQPLVSVLMASYNYDQFLSRALGSVLDQTYPHFEVIVCDDGSTDGSCEIANQYARRDGRIRLLEKTNGGVASALNAAYRESKGAIICLLDADDFFLPNKLTQVVEQFRQRPAAGMVFHGMRVVDAEERFLHQIPFSKTIDDGWIAEHVLARGGRWRSMPTSALAFRRLLADQLFPIPEALFRSEADGFLYTLAPLLTQVAFMREPLAGYRLHGANLTGATHLDADIVARRLDALVRKTSAVNERLKTSGLTHRRLSLARHLNWHEHRLMQILFENRPRAEVLPAFKVLAKALLADDLYSPLRKALGLFTALGAMLLPHRHRAAWLTTVLHGNALRRAMQWFR